MAPWPYPQVTPHRCLSSRIAGCRLFREHLRAYLHTRLLFVRDDLCTCHCEELKGRRGNPARVVNHSKLVIVQRCHGNQHLHHLGFVDKGGGSPHSLRSFAMTALGTFIFVHPRCGMKFSKVVYDFCRVESAINS